MKPTASKRLFSLLLAVVMVLGLLPAVAFPASAQHIVGLISASGITPNEGLILEGDTTLNMDTDLTVAYIKGDYNLTVEGSGTLTVNGSGAGIDVNRLNCTSNLFIQTGWHAIEAAETVYIDNAESFIVGGIYAGGHINIQCGNATIAGNDYAITSALGSVTLSGGTFDIGANGVAVFAKTGDIYMTGDFTMNSNESHAIMAERGEVMVIGSLKVTSGEMLDDPGAILIYGIFARNGFTFNGTTLDVKGFGGIDIDGDVDITADNVSILARKLSCIEGAAVSIDCDVLRLENLPNANDPEVGQYGIAGYESVIVNCPDATIIACDHGIYAYDCDVTLNGNFTIVGKGNFGNGIWVKGNLYLSGGQFSVASDTRQGIEASRVEASCDSLSVTAHNDASNTAYICGIDAIQFIFNGTTLTVSGDQGITADYTDITADSVVITTDVGTALSGDEVYVTANYLWAENKATKLDSDWLGQGGTQFGINAVSKLALTVKNGTVIGYNDALRVVDPDSEFEHHYIYVDGSLTAVSRVGAGMYVPEGTAEGYGGPIVSVGETHGIYAKDVCFDGYSLRVDGDTGIYAADSVELAGEDIKITAFGERNSGIWCENGYVDLAGKVTINTNGWYGINAGGDLTLGEGYYVISGPEGNAQAVKTNGTLTMDGTLEIVEPKYGHVNGNDIYGAGDSPALDVLIYSAIKDVSLLIDPPRAGELPTRTAAGIYFLDPRCTVEEIVWYEDGEEMVSQDALFRTGHSYTVKITISADGVYHFIEGVQGKVNDKAVSTGTKEKKIMYLTADMGECPKSVSTVELTITAPVEGKSPSTAVTDPSSEYGVYSRDVRWTVSNDGVNYLPMAAGEKFVGGKYYRVFMDVNLAGNDYKFPVTTATGSVQPDVISYVNGNLAVTEKAYDQDPETVITVYFDFGKCNDSVIEELTVVQVTAPVAGERPAYTAALQGTGYAINTAKNAQLDDYWNNPQKKPYYIKNGIGWFDMTEFDWVYENEYFIPGHEYQLRAYLKTEEGFEFAHNRYYEPTVSVTVNGNTATASLTGSDCVYMQEVECTFTCERQEIYNVMVYLDTPQAGKTPADYPMTTAYPEYYIGDANYGLTGDGVYWYDSQGNMLEPDDRFVQGEKYKVEIKLVPTQLEGSNLCQFTSPVTAYVNGKQVVENSNWDSVYASSNAVYIYYTFTKGATAPEVEPEYLPGDVNGDGNVTNEDVVALLWHTLFPEDNQIVGDADYTGDGNVTNEDVVVLLWHTLFPEENPLG